MDPLVTRERGGNGHNPPDKMAFMVAHGCSLMSTAVHSFPTRDEQINSSLLNLNANQMLNTVVNNGFDVVINY